MCPLICHQITLLLILHTLTQPSPPYPLQNRRRETLQATASRCPPTTTTTTLHHEKDNVVIGLDGSGLVLHALANPIVLLSRL